MARNIKQESAAAARGVLDAYWPKQYFPVDPVGIARDLGVKVFSAQLGSNVSGLLSKRPNEEAEIYVDIDDSLVRQRFTVAHELGHYLERTLDDKDHVSFVDRRDGSFNLHEFFANEFAGNLLMPADEVKRVNKSKRSIAELAAYFGVSVEAANVRLRKLDLK